MVLVVQQEEQIRSEMSALHQMVLGATDHQEARGWNVAQLAVSA